MGKPNTDTRTFLEDLINPQVMGDMISAKVNAKAKVVPYMKLDTTLEGQPGSTITIPKYGYIGDAVVVGEGEEIPTRSLSVTSENYAIKKIGIGCSITDEAALSGYGNPVGEAGAQMAKSIMSKTDFDGMDELQKAPTSFEAEGIISYKSIVNAIGIFEEEENSEKAIFIHPHQVTQLRLNNDFISKDRYNGEVMLKGEIGMIANARVVPSKKVPMDMAKENYLNPIVKLDNDTEAEEDGPALTLFL
ncbi:MAG: N4-gp56 family major capsid protein, partial [Anaerovoracaceae bacterium]